MEIVLVLNDGELVKYEAANFDTEALLEKLNTPRSFAVKIGTKVLQNGMIAAVAPATALERESQNLKLIINRAALYAMIPADELDASLTKLEADVNAQNFIECGGIIFNRGFYQIAEVI